jgi:hypothetical protein
MKKSFSQEVIMEIKKGNIKPIKKWKISLRNNAYWFILALLILLSGSFFSLIVSSFVFLGPEVFFFLKFRSFFRILIFAAPYLWIFAFMVCIISGILIFQKTKTGYRHSLMFVASMILLIVSVLGVSAHFYKINDRFENRFLTNGSRGSMIMSLKKEERSFLPKEGLLIGKITMIDENEFMIEDLMQRIWTIKYSDKTKMAKDMNLEIGEDVVIFGEKKEDNIFSALGIKKIKHNSLGRKSGDKNNNKGRIFLK